MLLSELKRHFMLQEMQDAGTYVSVGVTAVTQALLEAWALENNFELDADLHCTLLCSRVSIAVQPCTDEFIAAPVGFSRFGNAVAVELESLGLSLRHQGYINQGGVHYFDQYRPHLTLKLEGADIDITALSEVNFGLSFSGMKVAECL